MNGILPRCPWCSTRSWLDAEAEVRQLRTVDIYCDQHNAVRRELIRSRPVRRLIRRRPASEKLIQRAKRVRADRWLSTEPLRRWNRLAELRSVPPRVRRLIRRMKQGASA